MAEAETWRLLQTLFELAARTPAAGREQILELHCPDPQLRRRVLTMVHGIGVAETGGDASKAAQTPEAGSPRRLGPYTLLRLIGSGGIGSVYLAERILSGVPQRVALKVLAPHAAGAAFVERFRREQHILASLDHANITGLLDAGVGEDGQPYLVMPYVEGLHLDAYCDESKLDVPQRIALFLQVCDAVSHAHRNLVVHLDLKPSNVLVTAAGAVKLLDFGTSKLIQVDGQHTTTVLATPAYASPEQLRHEPVTTACDVYSLGAILFYLLSGRRCGHDRSPAVALERALNETEPEPLTDAVTVAAAETRGASESRLRQQLRGDLATITAKCLRPRARDRYASVDELAADLRRHLEGRSVWARPQTAAYRIGKFLRRNRWSAAASTLILLALIASLGYGALRQHQALTEGRRAMRMQSFVYRLFKLANSNYTGQPAATIPDFLRLGVRLLPDYIKDPADLRQAQLGLAESMFESDNLDDAQSVFRRVAATAHAAGDVAAEAEAEAFSGNIAYLQGQTRIGDTRTALALDLSRKTGVPPSVRLWSAIYYAWNRENNGFRAPENVELLEQAVKLARDNALPVRETADALYNLGSDQELRGHLAQASMTFRQALAVYDRDPNALCDRSAIFGDLAFVTQVNGDAAASLPLFQQAYQGYKTCSGAQSRGALTELEWIAGTLTKLGRPQEALPMMQSSMPAWRKLVGSNPDLSEPLYFLTLAELGTGDYAGAERDAKELIDVQTGKVAAGDRRFGASHLLWARALVGQNLYEQALPHAQLADRLLAINAVSVGGKQAAADAHRLLQDIQLRLHRP